MLNNFYTYDIIQTLKSFDKEEKQMFIIENSVLVERV